MLRFLRFEKSSKKHKKYMAILQDLESQELKRVHFGDMRYQHYQDRTYLNLYENLNHMDEDLRNVFRQRHKQEAQKMYSSMYFMVHYLW